MKLSNLNELVRCLQRTTSIKSKIEILKGKPELLPFLERVYDPQYKFHVRSSSLKGQVDTPVSTNYESIEELLTALNERKITGKLAISSIEQFISKNLEHAELIKLIIDKNLKARIGHDLIKRALDQQTSEPTISCALGFSLSQPSIVSYLKDSLAKGEEWFISRKFDGIRAFLKYDDGKFTLLSRRKVPIAGFNPVLTEKLQELSRPLEDFVLDGELVMIDPATVRDQFSETISTVKSLEPKPLGSLKYFAFDTLLPGTMFKERQVKLREQLAALNSDFIKLVGQKPVSDFNQEALTQEAVDSGFEGFILRRDSMLKDGRSRDLLKLKPFEDAEFRVTGREIGPMRVVVDGCEQEEQVLLSLTVDFKGFPVKVGSGFTIAQRREFAAMSESDLLGSLVTIRYQSESKAKDRKESSLRFPVFKHFHGKSRTL